MLNRGNDGKVNLGTPQPGLVSTQSTIQCSGNVNLQTMHWMETQPEPFPDMSVSRQCVDFEGLTEWRRTLSLNMTQYRKLLAKPQGAKEQTMDEQYFALFPDELEEHRKHHNSN